jgi:hypothetical protein
LPLALLELHPDYFWLELIRFRFSAARQLLAGLTQVFVVGIFLVRQPQYTIAATHLVATGLQGAVLS